MRCRCTAKAKLDVIDSRIVGDEVVKRKRFCPVCKTTYRTIETMLGVHEKPKPKPVEKKEPKVDPSIIARRQAPKPKKVAKKASVEIPKSQRREKEELGWSSGSYDDDLRDLGIDFYRDDDF